jgi:hypothetical protein
LHELQRISLAVAHCLDACCGETYPLARVADCLERLRHAGWRERDRRLVERSVLRALRRIARDCASAGSDSPVRTPPYEKPISTPDANHRQAFLEEERRAVMRSLHFPRRAINS